MTTWRDELEGFNVEERMAALEQIVESLVVATMRKPAAPEVSVADLMDDLSRAQHGADIQALGPWQERLRVALRRGFT